MIDFKKIGDAANHAWLLRDNAPVNERAEAAGRAAAAEFEKWLREAEKDESPGRNFFVEGQWAIRKLADELLMNLDDSDLLDILQEYGELQDWVY